MTLRHALLPIAAVLVLGVGVYLLVEVRAQPSGTAPSARESREPAPAPTPPRPPSPAPPREAPAPVPQVAAPAHSPPPPASGSPPIAAPRPGNAPPSAPGAELVGPTLDAAMAEANGAYDRGDFEDARLLAGRVLARYPTNVRMLRIMVSAACIEGDQAVALTHYARLPPSDQAQMKIRCGRYGVPFPDTPLQ